MRILAAVLMLILTAPIGSHANAESRVLDLIKERKFEEALQDIGDSNRTDLLMFRAGILGSGVLAAGADRCGAVAALEKAYASGDTWVVSSLDVIYGGDWAGIAALEGSTQAQLRVAERLMFPKPGKNIYTAMNSKFDLLNGIPYLLTAAERGSPRAVSMLETARKDLNDEAAFNSLKAPVPKEVICPART